MGEIEKELASQSGGVLSKAYDDLVHPSAASVGNTLSLVPRTVRVWLQQWEKWVINGEESMRLTAEAISNKVATIPEERLREPEPYVVVPAMQQITYCHNSDDLREMYANLISKSMDEETWRGVHPSFTEIIKQLTPDEAKMLRKLPRDTRLSLPLIDLQVKTEGVTGYQIVSRSYSNICDGICENPNNVSAYLENLARLSIIAMPEDAYIMDAKGYEELENAPAIEMAKARCTLDDNQRFEFAHRLFYVTAFGLSFLECCVYETGSDVSSDLAYKGESV